MTAETTATAATIETLVDSDDVSSVKMVFVHVPAGYETTTAGYFADEATGRLIFEKLKVRRLQRDAWRESYLSLYQASTDYAARVEEQTKILAAPVKVKWWKSLVPDLGIFAGVDHHGDTVVGIGAVWGIVKAH